MAASIMAPLAITTGEPAGIGPDICLALAQQGCDHILLADKVLLQQRAEILGLNIQFHDYNPIKNYPESREGTCSRDELSQKTGHLRVLHIPTAQPAQAGKLNHHNSQYVLTLLQRAVRGCVSGEFSGMVTAPVHKAVINEAGIPFTGHTEFLAAQTRTQQVVMMLVGGGLRVALATTHLPLREVADAITPALLESVLSIIEQDLKRRFGLTQPRILVAGLNPHAGEDGYLGREEIDIIIPVLNRLRAQGMDVSPPLPADTLFTPHRLAQCDCVLAMYHDQGLPVLKHASFGQGVNVTLGLPLIRTSVDHGTALDLAGTGCGDAGSLLQAIKIASAMVQHQHAP